MKKYSGILLAVFLFSIPAWGISWDIPFPSAYIYLMFMSNLLFSFVSIFIQTLTLRLYEANVYEEKIGILDFTFQYLAVYLSGINYHAQLIFNRTPFIINKLLAVIFCIFQILMLGLISGIYD